jgi:hypothetical protein
MTNEKQTFDLVKQSVTEIFETCVDERGLPVFGIIEIEVDGKPLKLYKKEKLFNAEDYQKAANYQMKLASNHKELADYYAAEYEKRQSAKSETF